jgi:Leucine-rich repeat (LRR) protein
MTDKKQPLVPTTQTNTSLITTPVGSNPVLRRMTDDALEWFRKKELTAQRFRIGEYEFCGPDYRQILHWAGQYGKSPEEVVETLSSSFFKNRPFDLYATALIDFRVINRKISSLVWDLTEFSPAVGGVWIVEKELSIESLGFTGRSTQLPDTLPKTVKILGCSFLGLEVLDLSPVPGLTELSCLRNQLTELDLSPVPGLTKLSCWGNELTELDLSPVPGLTKLSCRENQLTELDLSPVPGLTKLSCRENQLTELDLSPVPGLTELYCSQNELTELDLSPVPGLTSLDCWGNELTELDLSPVPGLTSLDCGGNPLTELDLSPVPGLRVLYCWGNELTELDLFPVPGLTELNCGGNPLTELDLSLVPGLRVLYCWKNKLTELDIRRLHQLERLELDKDVRLIGTPPARCNVVRR